MLDLLELNLSYSITDLVLDECHIGDLEAKAIGEVVGSNNCLKNLKCKGNAISSVGACHILKSMSIQTSCITHLDLSSNKICDKVSGDLSNVFFKSKNLINIDMRNN